MTKTFIKAALAATVATSLFSAPAMAADTKPFTATARIVKPLILTNVDDLDFGTITMLPALTSSDVTVGRAGGGADACGADLSCTAPTPASFTVAGSASQDLDVTIAAPLTLDDGAGNSVAFSVDAPSLITLDALGATSFEIGGTITVLSSTVDGTYTNTVDVTVEYS